jgi:hypothetical protein
MALSLGTPAGSVVNHIMSRQTEGQPEPEIGMGATLLGWTDRYAATIVKVEGDVITVQEDLAQRTDGNGVSESQTYSYEPDPNGMIHRYRFRNGAWEAVQRNERTGRWDRRDGYGLMLGVRRHYYDFSY